MTLYTFWPTSLLMNISQGGVVLGVRSSIAVVINIISANFLEIKDMVELEAKKVDGNIVISEDSFEHLLNCLDNQKFVGESPPNGDAMSMAINDPEGYRQIHTDNQKAIDDFNRQCRHVLHGSTGSGPGRDRLARIDDSDESAINTRD